MNRPWRALVLCAAVAGCSVGTQTQPSPPSSNALPTPVPASASAAVVATVPPARTRLAAYESGDGTWVVDVDGTHAHLLLAGAWPVAWSGDGSRLLVLSSRGLGFTDVAGSVPDRYYEPLCPDDVDADALDLTFCRTDGGAALSPDGTRLAYVIEEGTHDQGNQFITSTIAVQDLASGAVAMLDSTATTRPVEGCGADADHGANLEVAWSPDGARLLFTRGSLGPSRDGECPTAALSVSADGRDLRWIVPRGGIDGMSGHWSPDGTRIAVVSRDGTSLVDADGTNLRRVSDEVVRGWTRTGQLLFVRWTVKAENGRGARGDLWVMDANGGNATKLEATIPALTAAGCMTCPYPIFQVGGSSIDPLVAHQDPALEQFWVTTVLWQPDADGSP